MTNPIQYTLPDCGTIRKYGRGDCLKPPVGGCRICNQPHLFSAASELAIAQPALKTVTTNMTLSEKGRMVELRSPKWNGPEQWSSTSSSFSIIEKALQFADRLSTSPIRRASRTSIPAAIDLCHIGLAASA